MAKVSNTPIVNRWNDFDPLEEIVLGIADGACFPPLEPACQSEFNDNYTKYGATMSHPFSDYIPWPTGPKLKKFITAANKELDNLGAIMKGEDSAITIRRPDPEKCFFNTPTETPDFKSPNQYCAVCPRDVIMTIGNEIVEAPMCKRSRYFEYRSYRQLIKEEYFDKDPLSIWTAAPKPLMGPDSYRTEFWDWTVEERIERMHKYEYCLSEKEVMFDAADCLLIGSHIFVQQSMVTNLAGIRWLKRHFAPKGIQVRTLHFPYDLYPSHTDCTFVAVNDNMIITNPDRPFVAEEVKIFKQNEWRMADVPSFTNHIEHPLMCQSSRWLSMNVLSLNKNKIICEENEKPMINFLEKEIGLDVVPVPFRNVFEFGGSLHCSTWDVRRTGAKKNYFPNEEGCEDVGLLNLTDLP